MKLVFVSRYLSAWSQCLETNLGTAGFEVQKPTEGRRLDGGKTEAPIESVPWVIFAEAKGFQHTWLRERIQQARSRPGDRRLSPIVLVMVGLPSLVEKAPTSLGLPVISFDEKSRSGYVRAFRELLRLLEVEDPSASIHQWVFPSPDELEALDKKEQAILRDLFDRVHSGTPVLLLHQDGIDTGPFCDQILERARGRYPDASIHHIFPSPRDPLDRGDFFRWIADLCNIPVEKGEEKAGWQNSLVERSEQGDGVFLLISHFERIPRDAVSPFSKALQDLSTLIPRSQGRVRILACGGEKLAAQRYELDSTHSFLIHADPQPWPDPTTRDYLRWANQSLPGCSLTENDIKEIVDHCGGQPELTRQFLRVLGRRDEHAERPDLTPLDVTTDPIAVLFRKVGVPDRVCELLGEEDLGQFQTFWPPDQTLRRLYWRNLIRVEQQRYRWRGDQIRQIGRDTLGCG